MEEDIVARHKAEKRALVAEVTALKKSVSGGAADKKKKREVMDRIAAMEDDLKRRHEAELAAAATTAATTATAMISDSAAGDAVGADNKDEKGTEDDGVDDHDEAVAASQPAATSSAGGGGKKKSNRQQQRKAKKQAEFDELRKAAELEAANTVNMKEVEMNAIKALCATLKLRIKNIPADGHCLYNAIADQVRLRDDTGSKMAYTQVRKLAADIMRTHRDDYLPFLFNDNGDLFTESDYEKYCRDVSDTATWGGQLEIQALSAALKRPIFVIQMDGPIIKVGEDLPSVPLTISYHRHYYGLGEHYQSLVPDVEMEGGSAGNGGGKFDVRDLIAARK